MLADIYGGKKGVMRHLSYLFLCRLGFFRQEQCVDWERVKRLVFVCQGNICRSPFAEVLAKSAGYDAVSYGLHTETNLPANQRAIVFAEEMGIDLRSHRTSQIQHYVPADHDLVVVMEPVHLRDFRSKVANFEGQITLIGLWGEALRPYLHDPFSSSDDYFRHCYKLIFQYYEGICCNVAAASKV